MHIKLNALLLFLCLSSFVIAQTTLSRVTFPIDAHQTRNDLAKAGIDLSHGHGQLTTSFTTELQDYELERLTEAGIRFTVDIPDMSVYRKQHAHSGRGGSLECQENIYDVVVPQNFELGNVGGFFSLPEIIDQLDAMALLYPNLISVRKPIGNFKTWQNNSIFWVRISDHPETDEAEPEILYTSLTHARELITVSQTIYYMWYLLENYDNDPMIKQILDHTELYFVPVVNPDGLNYNVQGYDQEDDVFTRNLRKNMRDNNNDGEFDPKYDGVDINRNFGSHWGFDDEGSSSFEGSDVYRGPAPFSEPETKAIEFFCNAHDFTLALNHHAYGNLLVYPWGYIDENTPDSTAFSNYGDLLTSTNRFLHGRGLETVGYMTNGDSDDWMYAAHGTLAMTPEVGDPDDGFYPARERIIPLCKSTLRMNLLAARLVNSLIAITDETPRFIQPGVNPLQLEFSRYGLLDGEVEISFGAVTSNIQQLPDPITFQLDKFEAHERNLNYTVDPLLSYGSEVKIEIICKQGQYEFRDTLTKVRADYYTLVENSGNLSQWDTSEGLSWGNTNESYKSGPVSITDSPSGLYGANAEEIILLSEDIDLTGATSAYAQFWTKWDIEDHYDYVVFQASTDGQIWQNLCGERSKLGGIFQVYEQPLYDGKQTQWVLETSDLEPYLGRHIQLRFVLVSDGFVFKDGFYFDDFKVITIEQESVGTSDPPITKISAIPNPASYSFTIEVPVIANPSLRVFNALGHEIFKSDRMEGNRWSIDTGSWPAGIYHYLVMSEGVALHNGSVNIMR
jgi:hypothetical protein